MTAPVESWTVPAIDPVDNCPNTGNFMYKEKNSKKQIFLLRIINPPHRAAFLFKIRSRCVPGRFYERFFSGRQTAQTWGEGTLLALTLKSVRELAVSYNRNPSMFNRFVYSMRGGGGWGSMIGVGYQFKLACSIRKIGEFPSWHRRGRCAKGAAGVVAHTNPTAIVLISI
jgi:hypothetical protein